MRPVVNKSGTRESSLEKYISQAPGREQQLSLNQGNREESRRILAKVGMEQGTEGRKLCHRY